MGLLTFLTCCWCLSRDGYLVNLLKRSYLDFGSYGCFFSLLCLSHTFLIMKFSLSVSHTPNSLFFSLHKMDPGLSPFLEKPGRRLDALNDDSEYNLKQVIANLQFQLSSEKTEKKLLQQGKQGLSQEYEAVIAKKNDELASLQHDVQYLYRQREQLESKLQNLSDINTQRVTQLEDELKRLKKKNLDLVAKNDGFEVKLQKTISKLQYSETKLTVEREKNEQLAARTQDLQVERDDLTQLTQSLSKKFSEVSEYLRNDKSVTLQDQNDILLKSNSQLQLKIDELLQNKTSNELLKQQNISLLNKISRLEDYEQKYWNLTIANSTLQTKFDDYFKMINDSINHENNETNEAIVIKFVNKFKELKNSNLVLFDKYSGLESKLNEAESQIINLQSQTDNLTSKLTFQEALAAEKDQTIKKLQNQKLLNVKEIEFLRNSLKKFDTIGKNNSKEVTSEATNQYLTNLEKLVDDYKLEIENLKKTQPSSQSIGDKRPRLVDEALKPKDHSRNERVIAVEAENLKLLTNVKNLEDEIKHLTDKITGMNTITTQKQEYHILQLKSNPFTKDQAIKAKTLDLLREENKELIDKYVNQSDAVDVVPKSVFARQEHEKALLQSKIDQLMKKTNRLKSIYTDKSKEILSIISRYFGYSIEFIPNPVNSNDLSSRIKLVSEYLSKDAENNGFLVLDLNSKSLKANGSLEFKNLCEGLVLEWVDEKGQIPCFLSALNLKLYQSVLSK